MCSDQSDWSACWEWKSFPSIISQHFQSKDAYLATWSRKPQNEVQTGRAFDFNPHINRSITDSLASAGLVQWVAFGWHASHISFLRDSWTVYAVVIFWPVFIQSVGVLVGSFGAKSQNPSALEITWSWKVFCLCYDAERCRNRNRC